MVRRAATEPNTGFTGVVLVASLAMFRTSMAIFNAGISLPPPLRRWDLSVMVEVRGSNERAMRCGGWGRVQMGVYPHRASCDWTHRRSKRPKSCRVQRLFTRLICPPSIILLFHCLSFGLSWRSI